MPKPRVDLHSDGVRELLNAPGVRADLTRRAGQVLAAAVGSAPIGETGDYQASLHIEENTTDRAAVRVVADVDYAVYVEANTGNLARALDAAGGG